MSITDDRLARLLEVGRSLVQELDPDRVLERILEAARDLTGARYVALGVLDARRDALDRFLTLGVDSATRRAIGDLPHGRGVLGELITHPTPLRLPHVSAHPRSYGFPPGHPVMDSFLGVPVAIRGEVWGNLYLTEKQGAPEFSADDEAAVIVLSDFAATAIGNARSVAADRLRTAIASAEAERARWARELHDETLQALAGLRVGLSAALRRRDPGGYAAAIAQAVADIELEITNLRGIIADLRPSLLDDLGLADALRALIERRRADGLRIDAWIEIGMLTSHGADPAVRDLETTVYRLIQESLTNIVKHACATSVTIDVHTGEDALAVRVVDDGRGFDPATPPAGFGLAGMRERVFLLGGALAIDSGAAGTTLTARVPLPWSAAAATDRR